MPVISRRVRPAASLFGLSIALLLLHMPAARAKDNVPREFNCRNGTPFCGSKLFRSYPNHSILAEAVHRNDDRLVYLSEISRSCPGPVPTCPSYSPPCGGAWQDVQACRLEPQGIQTMQQEVQAFEGGKKQSSWEDEGEAMDIDAAKQILKMEKGAQGVDASPLQVFRLHDMYVDTSGRTLNASVEIEHGGCSHHSRYSYKPTVYPAGWHVMHFPRLIHMLHNYGIAYYHGLIEALPAFMSLAPFLREHPETPILMCCEKWRLFPVFGDVIMGLEEKDMNIIHMGWNDPELLFHAEELIQPFMPTCLLPNPVVMLEVRRRHFLHPEGFPMFAPGWKSRGQRPLTLKQMQQLPPDWKFVLLRRTGGTRALLGIRQIARYARKLFGKDRVVEFPGSSNGTVTKVVMNKAAVLAGGHGAGFSLMAFMPTGGIVFEMRQAGFNEDCYYRLAQATSHNHVLVMGDGVKATSIRVDLEEVKKALDEVRERVAKRLQEQGLGHTLPLLRPRAEGGGRGIRLGQGTRGAAEGGGGRLGQGAPTEEEEEDAQGEEETPSSLVPKPGELKKDILRQSLQELTFKNMSCLCPRPVQACPKVTACDLLEGVGVCQLAPAGIDLAPQGANTHDLETAKSVMALQRGVGDVPGEKGPGGLDTSAFQVFRLDKVYLDSQGRVFNGSVEIVNGGCHRYPGVQGRKLFRAGQPLMKFPFGVYMHHLWGQTLYNSLVEVFPAFLALAPVLRHLPSVPVIMGSHLTSDEVYADWGEHVLGVAVQDLVVASHVNSSTIMAVDELYQTSMPECKSPSPEVLFELRRRFLLHPQGFPMFRPGWRPRDRTPLTLAQMSRMPKDWLVIFVQSRGGDGPRLVGGRKILETLRAVYGAKRVVEYHSNQKLHQVKELFNRAYVIVGTHDVALSFMVFMPTGGIVVEVLQDKQGDLRYKNLAGAIGHHYHQFQGHGLRKTVRVDYDVLKQDLQAIPFLKSS